MRWFVEVSSLGSDETQSFAPLCVDAPQWQPALQKARLLRGDTGALANFSIEVLEDGYRAVDPQSRLRYLIRRAPDDTPLSMTVIPKAKTSSPGQAAPESGSAQSSKRKLVLRVLAARDEEPSEDTPLHYCERVFVVPKGVPDEEVSRLVLAYFDEMHEAVFSEREGWFVSFAVFDHVFEDKPRRRPVMTLTWKDWKSPEPEIQFPLRDARAARASAKAAPEAGTVDGPEPESEAVPSVVAVTSVTKTNPPPAAQRLLPKDLESAMHEGVDRLSSAQDALEGADLVLELVQEKLPCALAMISFHDPKAREFVVVRAFGTALGALYARTSEFTPIVRAALLSGSAVVSGQAASDTRVRADERWKAIGLAPASLVCLPLQDEGRHLGLLELVNPMDGAPFSEEEGRALAPLGQAFAVFLAARELLIEGDRIG